MNIHKFYRPILQRFRRGRMAIFCKRFALDQDTTVLDMGGGAFNWTMVPLRPRLTILDVYDHQNKAEWATYIVGDGCRTGLPSSAFDIVFSNSVIEHVGGIERQRQFAAECMRCGRGDFGALCYFRVCPETIKTNSFKPNPFTVRNSSRMKPRLRKNVNTSPAFANSQG